MKKILLSLLAVISFAFTNAQSREKGTVEITPKIGYSGFGEDNEGKSTDSNSGAEFGVTTDYYFNNRWSLRSGLVFDKMGGKYKMLVDYIYDIYTTPNPYINYEDKLNYLSIPLNANWHFGSTRKWNLNFGFSPSFLLSAKVNSTEIPKSTINSFQLALTYGIGYKFEVTEKFGILIDTQFFNGLTNINNASDNKIFNAGYSFNVGGVIQL
ncbi:porin family protein [Flavobacterium sp. M31R6]|uniref:porin family protein n=1 Tax=Flavobacterium sp. M31R6 TaxID=2739062 RepID=UPI001568265B|nr:porin family protein [Flavobacterium sp. M31R6]QKJ61981.1 PorT family protein [Flavobacterium sp. M31R6]